MESRNGARRDAAFSAPPLRVLACGAPGVPNTGSPCVSGRGDTRQTQCDPDTPGPCGGCVCVAEGTGTLRMAQPLLASSWILRGSGQPPGLQLSQEIMCLLSSGAAAVGAGRQQPGAPPGASPASSCQRGLDNGAGGGWLPPACWACSGGLGLGQPPPVLVGAHSMSGSELRAPHTLTASSLTTGGEVGLVLSCG